MRRIYNGRRQQRTEYAAIGDGEGAAGKLFDGDGARAGPRREIADGLLDVGVAVSTDRGLIVPVLRDADQLSFADIEKSIGNFAARARAGTITIEELTGGTFTITNGGVFGSLLSTPIVNSPQSAILGMHKIQDRPVVIGGQVVVRPMMYIALTYDHRIIDGREAVQFLVTVKQCLEDPARMVLHI